LKLIKIGPLPIGTSFYFVPWAAPSVWQFQFLIYTQSKINEENMGIIQLPLKEPRECRWDRVKEKLVDLQEYLHRRKDIRLSRVDDELKEILKLLE
jgi:hypothetical protein